MQRLIDESQLQCTLALIPMEQRTFRKAVETAEEAPTVNAVLMENIDKMIAEILNLDYNDFDAYEGASIEPQVSRDDVIEIINKYCKEK